jgi:toluene monooxygenase system protein E
MRSSALKTYSHLAAARRRPTTYELVTTELHHHVERGLAVDAPGAAWFERHQRGSRWRQANWGRFADPRETTYTKYTRLQHAKEVFCEGLLASIDDSGYDAALAPEARALLAAALPPLRFALHGFQMIAAYFGHLAPEGRVTIAAALQGADEVRRIQRIAYRMAQLRRVEPGFGADSRAVFERDEAWRPLREVVEALLVTWDWAEAFVALNLCVKPVVDELFMIELPAIARARGDFMLGQIAASLDEDCQWQRQWSAALARVALARDDNRGAAIEWVAAWRPRAERAARALAPALSRAAGLPLDADAALARTAELPRELGLLPPAPRAEGEP